MTVCLCLISYFVWLVSVNFHHYYLFLPYKQSYLISKPYWAIVPSTAYKRQTKRENVCELTADQIPVSKTDFLYKEDSYFHAWKLKKAAAVFHYFSSCIDMSIISISTAM